MKKRFLVALLSLCVALLSTSSLAGCFIFEKNTPPSTAPEYAQWLIDNLKSTYSVSAYMDYELDESSDKDEDEYKSTSFNACVSKKGDRTVSSVRAVTWERKQGQPDVETEVKKEFTESASGYSMTEYNDSKKVAQPQSLEESQYTAQAVSMLLPKEMLKLCLAKGASLELLPNTLPSKYQDSGKVGENESNDWTVLVFWDSIESAYSSRSVYTMEICVYKNKLSNIEFVENGYDDSGNEFYHKGGVSYDNTQNPQEPFSKEGYYASEAEYATEILNGMLQNQPERFQMLQYQNITLNGASTGSHAYYYVAYEKIGDTLYYYTKSSASDEWEITETYTKNGNGHIGRIYYSDNTYKETTCDEDLCLYINADNPEDRHTFINATNTSFVNMAQTLNYVDMMTVEFDEEGVCAVIFEDENDDAKVKTVLYIKDNVLQKTVIETTTVVPAVPGFTQGGTSVLTVTSTYTYNTAAINADLSGYTKA